MRSPELGASPREWRDFCLYAAQRADQYRLYDTFDPAYWEDAALYWLESAENHAARAHDTPDARAGRERGSTQPAPLPLPGEGAEW